MYVILIFMARFINFIILIILILTNNYFYLLDIIILNFKFSHGLSFLRALCNIILSCNHGLPHSSNITNTHIVALIYLNITHYPLPRVHLLLQPLFLFIILLFHILIISSLLLNLSFSLILP